MTDTTPARPAATITVKDLAEKVTAVYHEGSDLEAIMQNIARAAAEALGVELAPEPKPLPTKPGSVIIATEVRGEKGEWVAFLDEGSSWISSVSIDGYIHHSPNHITTWTLARVVPDTAAPVALTDEEVGEVWNEHKSDDEYDWSYHSDSHRRSWTATANAILAQHAAPAEDVPDWDDVRNAVASQRGNGWSLNDAAINGITDAVMRLLHREEA